MFMFLNKFQKKNLQLKLCLKFLIINKFSNREIKGKIEVKEINKKFLKTDQSFHLEKNTGI